VPTFAAAKYYKLADFPTALAVGDLNRDGKPDLAVAGQDSRVAVLLNAGHGTFAARRDYETGLDPISVVIGDFDGDGNPDLATANAAGGGYVSVLMGRGDGTFDVDSRLDYRTHAAAGLEIADLNGDGRPDLVTAGDGFVAVLLNRGDGTFVLQLDPHAGLSWPAAVATGDVNGDGLPDLVTANGKYDDAGAPIGKTVSVLINRGNGQFANQVNYKTGTGPFALVVADLNGDAKADIATTNMFAWSISVLLNRGDGTYRAKRDYKVGGDFSLAVGDLNGDRSPDLATVSFNEGSAVFALFNGGDGRFGVRSWLEYATKNPIAVAIADLNGDGRLDLATINPLNTQFRVSVLLNRPGLCNVQDVTEIPLELAKTWLTRGGCRVGRVRRVYSRYIKWNRVISQKPKFGAVRRAGGKVDLVVSRGRKH